MKTFERSYGLHFQSQETQEEDDAAIFETSMPFTDIYSVTYKRSLIRRSRLAI